MNKNPVIGQDVVVPTYGLCRVVSFEKSFIEVRSYSTGCVIKFDPSSVRLVKINFEVDESSTLKLKLIFKDEIANLNYDDLIDISDILEEEIERRDHDRDYNEEEHFRNT